MAGCSTWDGRNSPMSIFFGRLMAVSYGVGAALTLDEFALWLSLEPDAYWTREGRLSIDAVIIFGAVLAWERGERRFSARCSGCGASDELVRSGIGQLSSPIRRGRLLRRRKVRRSPPNIAQ